MTSNSFDRLLRSSRLANSAIGGDSFGIKRSIRVGRADSDRLDGKVGGGRARSGGGSTKAGGLARMIDKRTPLKRFGFGDDAGAGSGGLRFDSRQRAIVKVHYFNHAGGGGAALKEHARYIARDAAARDGPPHDLAGEEQTATTSAEARARAHSAYLSRQGQAERTVFYDAHNEGVDGGVRAEAWARSDKRHFRLILSAENGARLQDLPAYTREVMARAEAALGTKLQWVAVDHWDTANPHTHLIVRGRRANGQDLVLPKDFIRYGVHSIARDVATDWLGERTPADERLALDREVIQHGPTRLDRGIAAQLAEDRIVRLAALSAPDGDPTMTQALKARARELQRMGLAREVKRNVLAFDPDWQDRLRAMELHLDIRKRIVRERSQLRTPDKGVSLEKLARGLLGR